MLPCIFLREKRLAVLPNTVCEGLSEQDTHALAGILRGAAEFTCLTAFRCDDPPYDCIKRIDWAAEIYDSYLLASYGVVDDLLLRFSAGKLGFADFICEVRSAVFDGAYVQDFVAELNAKMREIKASIGKEKANRAQMLAECKSCRVYTSSINTETLLMSLYKQEVWSKVFVNAFPDDRDGLRLLALIYNNPARSKMKESEMFKMSPSNIEGILGLYESHGEDVAAGALRMCLLDPNPDAELDLNAGYIVRLKEKEARRREASACELFGLDTGKKKTRRRARAVQEHVQEPAEERVLDVMRGKAPPRYTLLWKRADAAAPDSTLGMHDLGCVVRILEEDDAADYFFGTLRGVSALATLEVDGKQTEGILEVGLREDKRTIYHLAFNPKKVKAEKVLCPEFDDAEDACTDQRCPVPCKIASTAGCYVLEYPREPEGPHRQLVIHPYGNLLA